MQNKPAQVAYMSHLSAGDSRSDSAYQPKVHLEVEWVGLVTSGLGFCWRRRLYWHLQQLVRCNTPPALRLRLLLVGGVSFACGLQVMTRLTAVFAEEVGGFGLVKLDGPI
jgi:hypothetical protein